MKRARYTKGISISLDPEQYETIKSITDLEEISIAEWFRAIAEVALQEEQERKKKGGQGRGGSK
jgi:hypothetical protein